MTLTSIISFCTLLVGGLLNAPIAQAARLFKPDSQGFNCERLLDPNYELVTTDRMSDEMQEQIADAAQEIFGENGVMHKLGISSPKQVIEFLSGTDLNMVGSLNRYPIGHWHDGAQLANADRSGLLYEIVIPGKTVRHSLHREDNTFASTLSIFFHIAGHNHFSVHNRFRQTRTADLVQESYDLDQYLEKLKLKVPSDEVSRWYQYLLSLTWAQDVIGNTTVSELDEVKIKTSPTDGRPQSLPRTANILQVYVANLSSDTPEWKREMALRFERLQRYITGAVPTKIMNEGLATLLQEIVPKHTKYSSFNYGIQYCCLMSGVTRKDVGNPYWLGLEAWRQLYKRFQAGYFTAEMARRFGFHSMTPQPAVGLLTTIEKDRAFIEWSTKNVVEVMDDAQFLEFAFKDGEWLGLQNLAIVRPVTADEWDRNMPRPNDPENIWQWVVASRDPQRVLRSLIQQVKGFELKFPNVEFVEWNNPETGAIHLEISDEIGRQVALEKRSMVETLYVHALINNRPVALESTFDEMIFERIPLDPEGRWYNFDRTDRRRIVWRKVGHEEDYPMPFYETVQARRVQVRVYPSGRVEAFRVLRDGSDSPDAIPQSLIFAENKKITYEPLQGTTAQLTKMLNDFVGNLAIDEWDPSLDDSKDWRRSTLQTLEDQIDQAMMSPSVAMQLAVPTAGKALGAYSTYVNRRLEKSLRLSMLGKNGISINGQRIQVRTLPNIPNFAFDRKSMKKLKDSIRPLPVKQQLLTFKAELHPDDLGRVVPIPGREGDRRWGPDPNGKSGQGDGDEDGEDSDDGDENQPGQKPGAGGNDPSWVDISLEAYAAALSEMVELPNLRPKGRQSNTYTDVKAGKIYKRTGTLVARDIVRKAYKRGMQAHDLEQRKKFPDGLSDEEKEQLSTIETIRKGLRQLRTQDFVVRGVEQQKNPEIQAQVTMMMDLSGSMYPFLESAKRIFYDLRAILMSRYKNIVFRFVAFDGQAHVFEDPEQFFKAQLGGGTVYHLAFEKDLEIKKSFPPDQYDRFSILIGDMEDGLTPQFHELFEEMLKESQFVAAFRLGYDPSSTYGDIDPFFAKLHDDEEFFGYSVIAPPETYTPLVFRKAFKNDKD